jgi:uncharacterized membrane protein YvlD (DUF360 family)
MSRLSWLIKPLLIALVLPVTLTVAGLLTGIFLASVMTGVIGWLKLLNSFLTL